MARRGTKCKRNKLYRKFDLSIWQKPFQIFQNLEREKLSLKKINAKATLPGWDLLPQKRSGYLLNCAAIAIYKLKIYYVIQMYLKALSSLLILASTYNKLVTTAGNVHRGSRVYEVTAL